MKRLLISSAFIMFVLVYLGLSFSGCDPQSEGPAPDDEIPAAQVYNKGVPEGNRIEQKIGPGGGSIQTSDGKVKITVPAGAVETEETFSIQAVSNTLPISTGSGYRLLPQNIQFNKPINISFAYSEADLSGTTPHSLYLAFQDDQGYWNLLKNTQLEGSSNVLQVETNHFNDLTCLPTLRVKAQKSTLEVNETTQMHVYRVVAAKTDNESSRVSISETLPSGVNLSWRNNSGGGTLSPNGIICTYKAPSSVPSSFTVEIEATFTGVPLQDPLTGRSNPDRNIRITTPITVTDGIFMEGSYGGVPFYMPHVTVTKFGETIWIQGVTDTGKTILMLIGGNANSPGTFSYGKLSEGLNAEIRCQLTDKVYETHYTECVPPPGQSQRKFSAGGIVLTNFPSMGEFLEGSFTATVYEVSNCKLDSKELFGKFRAPKGF